MWPSYSPTARSSATCPIRLTTRRPVLGEPSLQIEVPLAPPETL
jgi:hypothetical protein